MTKNLTTGRKFVRKNKIIKNPLQLLRLYKSGNTKPQIGCLIPDHCFDRLLREFEAHANITRVK